MPASHQQSSPAIKMLQKYWGHTEFRSSQGEIIETVLSGKDCFGLMPTGGGKSICFQVPGMILDGICLVISPLIALMTDQVQNLQSRGIRAIALIGGISQDETSKLLDNCEFGNYKFLYLSPERLQADWVLERIKKLQINLIAIDEAHCVSQWGHDFRPAYLKISKLKESFPGIPFLALTASATVRVKKDIIEKLNLQNPLLFEKSFARPNIAYMVFATEDKLYKMRQILQKNKGTSIIYVRNRKACIDISRHLEVFGIKATYYHGGLSSKEKQTNMQLWMDESAQVIVATNAFGMGIDKSNVSTVIHVQLPENIESYYQEAGRAGRNGDKAFAVLLISPADEQQAESQFLSVLPTKDFLLKIYIQLSNYFQIAYGEGFGEQFSFSLNRFCVRYDLPIIKTYNAFQFLDRQGILTLSQNFSEKTTIRFLVSSKEMIRYLSLNKSEEEVILTILRSYPGIYEVLAVVNVSAIAKKSHTTEENVLEILQKLNEKQIIEYHAKTNDSSLIFNVARQDKLTINTVSRILENQNQIKKEQFLAILEYVKDEKNCKSKLILAYFGEENSQNCGSCSNCIKLKKTILNPSLLAKKILEQLEISNLTSRELENILQKPSSEILYVLRNLLDNNLIFMINNLYSKKK